MRPYTKEKILDSIEALDEGQEQKVLDFINDILLLARKDEDYELFKRHAIDEINQALSGRDLENPTGF